MITYPWRQIQLIIPSRRFRSIECRHFYLFWKYVTGSLFPRIAWYSLFHTSDLSVLKHSFLFCQNFCAHVGHIQDEGLYTRYRSVAGVTELSNTFCTSKFLICKYGLLAFRGAGVIHAGSRRGYMKTNSRIELCMVYKGFGGRQYQKATLASNPKRD
jgi:hypothetical protein